MAQPKNVLVVNQFYLPSDSVGAKMVETWKRAGGTYRDLFTRALMHYSVTGQYGKDLKQIGKGEK